MIKVVHFSDPGCPWAWSASPALSVLHWRYGAQLQWRHVMIGLTERGADYERRGYTDVPRPEAPLVWLHAASVGELLAIVPIVEHICAEGFAVSRTACPGGGRSGSRASACTARGRCAARSSPRA